jgi:hypothetical protein
MTEHDDATISDWLAAGEGRGRPAALEVALAAARSTKQRPAWAVTLASGTFGERRGAGSLRLGFVVLGAVLVLGALLVGGLGANRVLPPNRPSQPVVSAVVAPNTTATASRTPDTSPSAGPSAAASGTGLVAYVVVDCPPGVIRRCTTRPWLAHADGSDAHVLAGTGVVGWAADGSKLVLEQVNDVGGAVSLLVADPTGTVTATVQVPCEHPEVDVKHIGGGGFLCPDTGEYALSPDGARVAYTRNDGNVNNSSVLSVLDLATGQATVFEATRTTNPPSGRSCNTSTKTRTCQGFDGAPRWSPDGQRIAFERQLMAPEPGDAWDASAVFVVDANGNNLRRVTPRNIHAQGEVWSADGSGLAFNGAEMVVNAAGTSVVDIKDDIYTIGVDGSGLARLTHDGISSLPDWTSAGSIAFIRHAAPTDSQHWIMDGDGGNPRRLGNTLAELSAAGCTTCIYVAHEPVPGLLPSAYWQPMP